MKRYKQLREMPYNNEYTWNERTNLPYPRLTVGIDRRDPDGAVTIMQVRTGVNYLCDDYRGPFADRNDKQLIEMAKQLVTAVGVDRIRPHYYTEENGHTKVHVGKDIHITEWANAPELCSALRFSRFLNRDGQQLFQVRNGQRIIENYADGSRLVKDVQTVDDTHFYVGSRFCHIQQYANQCFKRGCYVEPEHPQPGDKLDRMLIYQIPHYTCEYRFTDYDYAQNKLKATDYRCAYVANMPRDYTPDKCFRDFNYDDRPCANSMPSLSVSDLIVMERSDKAEALYVDAVGFKDVSRPLLMTYTKNREGYLIPSLSLPNQPNPYLNRYARLRLEYLEQNEPTLCDQLMLEGTLLTSCSRIGRAAQQMVDKTLRELMQTTPMPDRRTNPLGWAKLTNSLKKQAEEAVLSMLYEV